MEDDDEKTVEAELMEYLRGGMAEDLRGRYGKAPPASEAPVELDAEGGDMGPDDMGDSMPPEESIPGMRR
jgi:hypothetical protein